MKPKSISIQIVEDIPSPLVNFIAIGKEVELIMVFLSQ